MGNQICSFSRQPTSSPSHHCSGFGDLGWSCPCSLQFQIQFTSYTRRCVDSKENWEPNLLVCCARISKCTPCRHYDVNVDTSLHSADVPGRETTRQSRRRNEKTNIV